MPINIEKYFSPTLSIERLKRLSPSPKSPVLDAVYPATKQDAYPKSRLAAADLPSAVKNFPVIQRGAASHAVSGEKTKVAGYEPFPVEVVSFVSDAELNDLRNLTEEDINGWIDLRVQRLKDGCKATAEALSAQSLSGKIAYSMQSGPGVFDIYNVDFGSTKTHIPVKLWNVADASIATVLEDASLAADLLGESGFDSSVLVFCGSGAFKALVKIATSENSRNFQVTVTENDIVFPGFTFRRLAGQYYDYKTKAYVRAIPEDKVVFIGTDAPFWLPFCSLDNAEANFQALPFWSSVKRSVTGKGFDICGESKPFPVPIVKALVWAKVV